MLTNHRFTSRQGGPRFRFGIAACALLTFTGCAASHGVDSGKAVENSGAADAPVFDSIESLSAKTPSVLLGKVGPKLETRDDRGGNTDPAVIPTRLELWSFTVTEALKGSPATPTITIATLAGNSDVRVSEGDNMMLFVEPLTAKDAPVVKPGEVIYVPVGGVGGLFDVKANQVQSRGRIPALRGTTLVETGAPVKADALTIDAIRSVVKQ